jgi:hypothetical protein
MLKTMLTNLNKTKCQLSSNITPKLNILFLFLKRIFNRYNLTKILIIFLFGFSVRLYINIYYDINVFTEFLSATSLTYYLFISCFAVVVHEYVTFFNFSIFPSSFCSNISFLFNLNAFSYLNPFTLFKKYSCLFSLKINTNIDTYLNNVNENKLSFKIFIKEYLVFLFEKISKSKNTFFAMPSAVEEYSPLPETDKNLKSHILLKNNKGKETSLPGSESVKEKNPSRRIHKHSDRNSYKYKEENQQATSDSDAISQTENKLKDTPIKSTNDSPKYPSRIFFGDNYVDSGSSAIFNITEDSSSNSNYETLSPTVYRAESNGESSRPMEDPSQTYKKYYTRDDFQLYGNSDSDRNTPSTMTPLFQSREPSVYNNTLTGTSDNIARTSLKFEDLTISHPLNRSIKSVD